MADNLTLKLEIPQLEGLIGPRDSGLTSDKLQEAVDALMKNAEALESLSKNTVSRKDMVQTRSKSRQEELAAKASSGTAILDKRKELAVAETEGQLKVLNARKKIAESDYKGQIGVIQERSKATDKELDKRRKTQEYITKLETSSALNIAKIKADYSSRLLSQKERSSDKSHKNALERIKTSRDLALRNSLTASSGIGIAALMTAFSVIGRNVGNAQASLITNNSAVRPDLTYTGFQGAMINSMTSALSGVLMGAGAAVGGTLGGPVGAGVGLALGGVASTLINYVAPLVSQGLNIPNSANYLSQLSSNVYGKPYGGLSSSYFTNSLQSPGGFQYMPAMQQSYYGSVGSAGAFKALSQATQIFGLGTNTDIGQIIPQVALLSRLTGMGNSPGAIGSTFNTLGNLQMAYGGDASSNLSAIVSLLSSSSFGQRSDAAFSSVYSATQMNPALISNMSSYASASPIQQGVSRLMIQGITGLDMNSLSGLSGAGAQRKAVGSLQKEFKGIQPGEMSSRAIKASMIPGFWNYMDANTNTSSFNGGSGLQQPFGDALKKVGQGQELSQQDWYNLQPTQAGQGVMNQQQTGMSIGHAAISITSATFSPGSLLGMDINQLKNMAHRDGS